MKKITIPVTKTLLNWIGILSEQQMQTSESFCELIIRNFVSDAISNDQVCPEEDDEPELVVQGFKKD